MPGQKLIQANGLPRFGVLSEPVDDINYLDFDLRSNMNRRRSHFARRWAFNQFQFIGLLSPDLMVGCAIVDLGLVSNAFVYFYDVKADRLSESGFLRPFGVGTRMETSPDTGSCSFVSGKNRFEVSASGPGGHRRLEVELASGEGIHVVLSDPADFEPLRVCSRAGYAGWVYTQKAAGLQVEGSVDCHGRSWDLSGQTFGTCDWSAGFMRRETFWNWACLAGTAQKGQKLGLNLAAGVNETGFTENGFWSDSQFTKVDMVDFRFDRDAPLKPWTMRSADGRVDLRFQPCGKRSERIHAGLIASNFNQAFGHYDGTLQPLSGPAIQLSGVPGFAEDHYAKW